MSPNATKLDRELKAASVPVLGCDSTGRIDFASAATPADKAKAAAILAAHDPTPDPAPPSIEDRFLALEARLAKLEGAKA